MLRHECLGHVIVLGETQPRRIRTPYAAYYNQTRPFLVLQKDAPLRRTIQWVGAVAAIPMLGGLHHR